MITGQITELELRIDELEIKELEKKCDAAVKRIAPGRRAAPTKECSGSCRPTPCYKNGRQMVMSLTGTAKYGPEELHFRCPGCSGKHGSI